MNISKVETYGLLNLYSLIPHIFSRKIEGRTFWYRKKLVSIFKLVSTIPLNTVHV